MGSTSERSSPSVRPGHSHSHSHRRSTSSTQVPQSQSTSTPREEKRSTKHYTVKTPNGRPPPVPYSSHGSHSQTQTQAQMGGHSQRSAAKANSRGNTPTTSTPWMPHSVGQAYPPRGSSSSRPPENQDAGRVSSPNYFDIVVEEASDPRDSAMLPKGNWSPPTSSVKSFAAAIPKQMPLDANPEFEAFRRQADANRGNTGFLLQTSRQGVEQEQRHKHRHDATPSVEKRPRAERRPTHDTDNISEASIPKHAMRDPKDLLKDQSRARADADNDSQRDSAYVSADSKRNSETSLNAPSFLSMTRHESPASFESPTAPPSRDPRSGLADVDDKHPRLSMTSDRAERPAPDPKKAPRAMTVPSSMADSSGANMLTPAQLRNLIEDKSDRDFLLLDLRVSPQYAQSRIQGALNLCIPTTLLKRATFNLQKLQSTFSNEDDQARFARWHEMTPLVVYDAFSSEKRDAVSAINTIKKFTNEGYTGATYILQGGFNSFANAYPHLVDKLSRDRASPSLSLNSSNGSQDGRPMAAPVIGGVMLPNASSAANPFFSEIRQNAELANGVGQMDVALPADIDVSVLPEWLREATSVGNHGKKVSDRFLSIELKEQSRMKDAYSSFNMAPGTTTQAASNGDKVELSGVEKGVKNRYKNILPFEHARVKLNIQEEGACDYVNASHIKPSRSHKRYIASQGPLPATFEDFWSVIWDQDVRVIVMLTAESEGGQLKCHPYWKGQEFGAYKLRSLSEKKVSLAVDKHRSTSIATETSGAATASASNADSGFNFPVQTADAGRRRAATVSSHNSATPALPTTSSAGSSTDTPYVIIRKFALSHAAHPFEPIREITHLHFPSWPDFGAPAQPAHLLALVELANVMQRASMPHHTTSTAGSGMKSPTVAAAAALASPSTDRRGSSRWAEILQESVIEDCERNAVARPMLVHCSAGCGRTGTFCTVDSVIDMLKRQRVRDRRVVEAKIKERESRFAAAEGRQLQSRVDDDGDISMSEDGEETEDNDVDPMDEVKSPAKNAAGSMAAPPKPPKLTQTNRMSFYYTGPSQDISHQSIDSPQEQSGNAGEEEDATSDIDLSWLTDETIDLVAATVADFRGQRISMVQSLRQFVLCYESVAEWIWSARERDGGKDGGLHSA